MPPWLLLAVLISLSAALLYQLLRRRTGWRVLAYWIIVLVGLLAGEAAAESLGWDISRFGDLRVLPDLAGVLTALGLLRVIGL